ncbi:hypothetical protein [Streptomyces massasporeus]
MTEGCTACRHHGDTRISPALADSSSALEPVRLGALLLLCAMGARQR